MLELCTRHGEREGRTFKQGEPFQKNMKLQSYFLLKLLDAHSFGGTSSQLQKNDWQFGLCKERSVTYSPSKFQYLHWRRSRKVTLCCFPNLARVAVIQKSSLRQSGNHESFQATRQPKITSFYSTIRKKPGKRITIHK